MPIERSKYWKFYNKIRERTKSYTKSSGSESTNSIYNKLYEDSQLKKRRIKECKQKHKLAALISLSTERGNFGFNFMF